MLNTSESFMKYYLISSSCGGKWSYHHRNIGIVLSKNGEKPLSIRQTNNCEVHSHWRKLNVGVTNNTQYARQYDVAKQLVDELNANLSVGK